MALEIAAAALAATHPTVIEQMSENMCPFIEEHSTDIVCGFGVTRHRFMSRGRIFRDTRYDHFRTLGESMQWKKAVTSRLVPKCAKSRESDWGYLRNRLTKNTAPWQCRHRLPTHGAHIVLSAM